MINKDRYYSGKSLKNSKQFARDGFWIAQTVLEDDEQYTIDQARELVEKARNERLS